MKLSERPLYLIGDLEVDPAANCLRRNGAEQTLRQKSLQVLLYLLEHRARLVTKDELIKAVWGGAAVTDGALVQIIADLRRALGDDSRQPRFIRTVSKAGYRFIGPVEELWAEGASSARPAVLEIEEITSVQIEVEEPVHQNGLNGLHKADLPATQNLAPPPALPAPAELQWFKRQPALFATLGISLALALSALFYFGKREHSLVGTTLPHVPGKKSVAVMYFENQSGDRELDWLREGLADMLITGLSRSSRLTVLSRQQLAVLLARGGQAQAERLRLEDGLEIARRSQAEVIVLGSFAKLGEKMRVDVQLFAVQDGQLQAAESLVAEQPGEILSRLDLLSLKLATHLGVTPDATETQPGLAGVMTDNLDAYRYYSLALEQAQNYHPNEALALLDKASALDPQFAMAYARIGYVYIFVRRNELARARPYLERALQLASRLTGQERLYVKAWLALAVVDIEGAVCAFYDVITHYPRETEAYYRLSFILRHSLGRRGEALRVLEQAAVIDPDSPQIHNELGFLYQGFGRYDEAVAAHTRYVQLAPSEPNAYDSLGMTYSEAGHYQEALQTLNRALALNPDFHFAARHVGDVYFQQGRYRDALRQYQRYLALAPSDWDRAQAAHLMARVHLARGAVAQAAEAARQELRYGNDFGDVLLVALARGEWKAAKGWCARWADDEARKRDRLIGPDRLEYLLGLYALKTGSGAEALARLKAAQHADDLYWNIDTTIDGLGSAYLELGHLDEAIAEYERLIKLNPNWARAHYHLGQAYERKDERKRARAAYEKFLQVWKDADADIPEVIEAKRRLNTF
jgi:tetratricopeptide (TPR) repeat protein/DNA-binding winged helix-turn-helix (wHTH) protein